MAKTLTRRMRGAATRGQALVEFSLTALIFLLLMFGIIDFGRAVYSQVIVAHLAREGANLASRGTPLTDAVNAVIGSSSPLDFAPGGSGFIVITRIAKTGSATTVEDQKSGGGSAQTSKMGSQGNNATNVPSGLPATGDSLYVAEVFYKYKPITPIGSMLGITFPSVLYDAAYF
jgi:Flp pilus assembly protein TadG